MIEHHIQIAIVDRLSRAEQLRFSELKPEDLESNAFMYHLNRLITDGYVRKSADGYCLDSKGLTYVDSLTMTNKKPRKQPKLIGIMALQNADGGYLLAQRKLQPSLGTWMFLSGKQHFGESPEVHIEREVREQLGVPLELKRRGLFDIRMLHEEAPIIHLSAQVYTGHYDGPLPEESAKFRYAWHHIDDNLEVTPGTRELADTLANTDDFFFLSLDVNDK